MNILAQYNVKYDYRETLKDKFINNGIKLKFKRKSLIEFEHKKLNYVYLIISGRVKQYFINNQGAERTILILSAGDIFGEVTLFQEDFDMVITETLEETELIRINGNVFLSILNSNPEVHTAMYKLITTKFRILMSEIHDLTFYSTKDRLIALLNRLSKQNGVQISDGVKINLKLTHEEIAAMIATSRSTVTKLLSELQGEGLINIEGKYIILQY